MSTQALEVCEIACALHVLRDCEGFQVNPKP